MDAPGVDVDVLIQVGVAVLAGGAIGVERELRGREAGLRTMILVCLGSTIVMMVSHHLSANAAAHGIPQIDPTRIAAGIVTGIGFVGGGVILKQRHVIQGVTTAAAIWFVAGLGIAIGDRLYGLVLISTLVALIVLALLQYPEQLIAPHIYRTVTLTVDAERAEKLLDEVRRVLDEERAIVMDLEAHHDAESRTTTLSFSVRTTQRLQAARVVKQLGGLEGVRRAAWS